MIRKSYDEFPLLNNPNPKKLNFRSSWPRNTRFIFFKRYDEFKLLANLVLSFRSLFGIALVTGEVTLVSFHIYIYTY